MKSTVNENRRVHLAGIKDALAFGKGDDFQLLLCHRTYRWTCFSLRVVRFWSSFSVSARATRLYQGTGHTLSIYKVSLSLS